MPYNINPPCEEGFLTRITWQFPGEEEKTILDGDDYEVSLTAYDCPYDYHAFVTFNIDVKTGRAGNPGYGAENWQEPNYGALAFQRLVELKNIDKLLLYEPDIFGFVRQFYKPYIRWGGITRTGYWSSVAANTPNSNADYFDIETLRNVQLVLPSDPHLQNCGQYDLNIYREGEIILTDSGRQKPTVTWECQPFEECPEDTCEVICGDWICCYGSNGKAKYRLPNTRGGI